MHQPKLLILLMLLIMPFVTVSQLATFTSNQSEGCSPLAVTFTADYNGATSYLWNFDNGNVADSSVAYATFINPGVYTVQLTVTNGSNTESWTMDITVFSDPVPGYTLAGQTNNGCQPSQATLIDLSTPGDAPIVSWFWDFGDGVTQLENSSVSVNHNYSFHGDYSISLEVTDANGCSDILLLNDFIHVSDLPFVSFYADITKFCEVPGAVVFTNSSTGFGSLTNIWSFGDGAISIASNPSHTYLNYGYYDVTLEVTDGIGCTNNFTISSYIQIDSVRANFTIPDTICAMDPFIPANSTTGANTYNWDWVIGTSTLLSPEVTIGQGGHYIFTLDASLNGICNDYHTDTIFVESFLAYYVPSQSYICELPTLVTYNNLSLTNNSQGFDSIYWEFELYGSLAPQSPTSDFTPIIEYDYEDTINAYNNWTYYSSLEVITPFGCIDNWEDTVIVWLPTPRMNITQNTSCVPCLVNVADTSVYTSPYDSIVSWEWNFGDFSAPYFGQFPPQHAYLDSGIYEISLTIITAEGCEHTTVTSITCGYAQNASFIMISPDTICGNQYSEFLSTSTDTAIINSYYWQYSDGQHSGGDHAMAMPFELGWIDITLTVSHNGCDDDTSMLDAFYVLGPLGFPRVVHDCENTLLYTFSPNYNPYNGFVGVDHFYWDFGDGSSLDSVNQVIDHLYTISPLDTFIYLTLVNDQSGCIKRDSIPINVRDPHAEFTMDTTKICPGDTILFDASSSIDYYEYSYAWNTLSNFQWNFDDGNVFTFPFYDWFMPDTATTGPISYVFNVPGEYNVRLIIRDLHGCPDTVYHPIKVYGIDPEPTAIPPSGCTPITCSFIDNTISDTTLVSWFWTFGQGDTSILQNPTNIVDYTIDGSYTVTLFVIDALGCFAYDSIEVVASTPVAEFFVSASTICYGDTIFFIDSSITYSSSPQYIWDFGDGTFSNEHNPFHVYEGGAYTVSLLIYDGICSTDYTFPLDIVIQDPNTEIICYVDSIPYDSGQVVCAPEHVIFRAEPYHPYFSTMIWNLGDGTPSQVIEPGHNYSQPGIYPVTLKVYTSASCHAWADTLFLNVALVEADLFLSKHEICLGDSIDLVVQNQVNVDLFEIDFGDGSPYGTDIVNTHTYDIVSQFGYLVPSLRYWAEDSVCEDIKTDTLYLKPVMAFFDRGSNDMDTAACYNLKVDFINNSIGADQYSWNFGDGSTSWDINPSHNFNTPGNYLVSLEVFGLDCRNHEDKWIYVWPPPDIDVDSWNEICYGDSVQLDAQGGSSYLWTPDTFLTNNIIHNPIAIPPFSVDYNLHVIDTNDCSSDETVNVFVQQTPVINLFDTTIIVGEIIDLPDSAYYNVEYFWSPDYGLFSPNEYNPGFQPLVGTGYTVSMFAYADGELCDTASAYFYIDVLWQFTVDVPQVFTPNGDGVNDIVFVRGWGIRDLIDFRIYNRWGEVVFRTDDINVGWDGIYKGQLQTSDTYIYDVEIETYDNRRLKKKGSITLMR